MKKIKMFIIVSIISTLLINTKNVYAEGNSFNHGQFNYTIEGLYLNVYKITETDGETDEESITNYLNEIPMQTIEIPTENIL